MANPLPPVQWHAKPTGAYADDSQEGFENAAMIYSELSNRGWTLNAIAGVLANLSYEGQLNPWRWQDDIVLASTDTSLIATSWEHGYGLAGFTPAGNYIYNQQAQGYSGYGPNFSDVAGNPNDGNAQVLFIDIQGNNFYWVRNSNYNISFNDYKISNQTPSWLAAAWMWNYEYPGDPYGQQPLREAKAIYWYNTFLPYDPNPPTPPTPTTRKSMPLWMMLRRPF